MPTPEEIQTAINNLTSSSDITEMVTLAAEINDITEDRVITVAAVDDLPDLATISIAVGTVFFVQSLNIPVVAGFTGWRGLDNRLLRQDLIIDTIYSWGRSQYGRLGDNTLTTRSSPVSVVGGFTNWCQVSAGCSHSLAIRQNGTAWAWGDGRYGRLGDNTIVSKLSPVSVIGGFTDWCQISAGNRHSLALRTNGTAWGWGRNGVGYLGDDTTTDRSSPVSVVGGFTDWSQVAAGVYHSLGVRQEGTAWAWGFNSSGQLGDNTNVNKSSPVSVVGGFTDWCQVSAGTVAPGSGAGRFSLGVRQNGTAWGWGANGFGYLGDGITTSRSSPVSVIGGFTDWCQVSAGARHSLGARQNGSAWAWGFNSSGQLGDNTTVNKSSPVSVIGGFTDWCQVSAGANHSLAVRQNGTAWGWGCNSSTGAGQLGDGTTISRSSPVSVIGGFTDWCQVSAGSEHSLGVRRCF